jgi:hypothetical protein
VWFPEMCAWVPSDVYDHRQYAVYVNKVDQGKLEKIPESLLPSTLVRCDQACALLRDLVVNTGFRDPCSCMRFVA